MRPGRTLGRDGLSDKARWAGEQTNLTKKRKFGPAR